MVWSRVVLGGVWYGQGLCWEGCGVVKSYVGKVLGASCRLQVYCGSEVLPLRNTTQSHKCPDVVMVK